MRRLPIQIDNQQTHIITTYGEKEVVEGRNRPPKEKRHTLLSLFLFRERHCPAWASGRGLLPLESFHCCP